MIKIIIKIKNIKILSISLYNTKLF